MDLTFKHLSLLPDLSAEDKLYLEKKRPQPKDWSTTLVSDNKTSKAWAFLFQNLVKWDERNIVSQNLQLTTWFC